MALTVAGFGSRPEGVVSRTGKAAPPGPDGGTSGGASSHAGTATTPPQSAVIAPRPSPPPLPPAFGTGRRTGADGAGTAGGQERTERERLADGTADATLSVEGSEPFSPPGWDSDGPTVM